MTHHPQMAAETGRVEPSPRRVRGYVGATLVLDTISALYVWEKPHYPWYYVPLTDVTPGVLVDEHRRRRLRRGEADVYTLRVGDRVAPSAVHAYDQDTPGRLAGYVKVPWDALDAWYEEDEEIFVHPRNPYVRVDAVRSHLRVRIEEAGVLLAESRSPVLVFETGLPTRYYLDPTDVRRDRLIASDTVTQCPYKGRTTRYWSTAAQADVAWCYDFPTPAVSAVQGLIAFYDEKLDITVDGRSAGES